MNFNYAHYALCLYTVLTQSKNIWIIIFIHRRRYLYLSAAFTTPRAHPHAARDLTGTLSSVYTFIARERCDYERTARIFVRALALKKKKNKNKRRDAAQLGAYMEICEAYVWISDKATLCGASDVSANSRAGLKASERRPFVKSASERKCAKFFLTSEWFLMCVYAWRQLSMMNGGPKLKAYLIN